MAFMPKSEKNDGKYRRSSDGKAPRPSTDCKNGGLFQVVVLEVARWTKRTKEVWNKGIKGNTRCKQTLH